MEQLDTLFNQLMPHFSESEQAEIQEFVEVGEYGIALDTAVDIVVEEHKQLAPVASQLVLQLADLMELDSSIYAAKLRIV